jgi:hypothetical protein
LKVLFLFTVAILFAASVPNVTGATYGSVTFTVPGTVIAGQPFTYNVTFTGFEGNFSGYFYLGSYALCGWAGNLKLIYNGSGNHSITDTCQPTTPAVLIGKTVQASVNANATYYYGPYVTVLDRNIPGSAMGGSRMLEM